MVATKDDHGGERNDRTAIDLEEDFLSLIPVDDGKEEQTNAGAVAVAADNEDFISLIPTDEGTKEQTNAAAADNDATEKSGGKRSYDKRASYSLPPWMEGCVDYRSVSPMVAFHNEIVAFCKLMEPRDEEMKTREELVARFTVLAKSIFRDCKVEVFGSQATG